LSILVATVVLLLLGFMYLCFDGYILKKDNAILSEAIIAQQEVNKATLKALEYMEREIRQLRRLQGDQG
jgi:cell division protein FtsB